MKSGLLLDVVVGQSATILELLTGKDKTLLIRGDSFLVLDLGLDVVDGVARLNIKGDGFTSESLYEDLRHGKGTLVRECDIPRLYFPLLHSNPCFLGKQTDQSPLAIPQLNSPALFGRF